MNPDDLESQFKFWENELNNAGSDLTTSVELGQSVEADMAQHDLSLSELNAQIEALQEKKREITARKTALNRHRWDAHSQAQAAKDRAKRAQEEMDKVRRQEALAAELIKQQARFEAQKLSWNELTEDALWRDYAYQHQLDGSDFMAAAQKVICADEMGLGKTLQAFMTYEKLLSIKSTNGRCLIITTGEACMNFERECDRWCPEIGIINLANKGTVKTIEQMDFWVEQFKTINQECVVLINYEILARSQEVVDFICAWGPNYVICDEAHKVKNTDNNTYKAIEAIILGKNRCGICDSYTMPDYTNKIIKNMGVLAHSRAGGPEHYICPNHGHQGVPQSSVENIIMMTGTPLRNRPQDMFPLLHLVHPEIFAKYYDYEGMFCSRQWDGTVTWSRNGYQKLVEKIKGFYICRKRGDSGIKLPPQTKIVHEIEPDKNFYHKQREILRRLKAQASIEIDEGRVASIFSVLPLITRQRQASVWPGGIYMDVTDPLSGRTTREHVGKNYLESAKLDKAVELIDEFIDNEQRTVVFSDFLEPLLEMQQRLGDKAVLFAGPTPKQDRDMIKQNWDRQYGEAKKWDVILCHYKLGGESLNFTAATQMIILDEYWNSAGNEQAYKRIDRGGQTEETAVHILRLVMPGSFDKAMAALIEKKKAMIGQFETEFKFQELAELFRDS